MLEVGDWVEGDNGYGVIHKIYPEYYQFWEDDIPEGNEPGDKKQDVVIIKRFCSFYFKVYPQTRAISIKYVSKISNNDMKKVKELLKDEKKSQRFKKYKVDDGICEIANWDQYLTKERYCLIESKLETLENNGNLNMTMREVESYLEKEFGIDLINGSSANGPSNYYVQVTSVGLGVYKDHELLFKKIGIVDKK